MIFKLGEQVAIIHDGKWVPLEWNSRSVIGTVIKVQNRKKVKILFHYENNEYQLWFNYRLMKYRAYKTYQHNGGFLNFYEATKLSVFEREMSKVQC